MRQHQCEPDMRPDTVRFPTTIWHRESVAGRSSNDPATLEAAKSPKQSGEGGDEPPSGECDTTTPFDSCDIGENQIRNDDQEGEREANDDHTAKEGSGPFHIVLLMLSCHRSNNRSAVPSQEHLLQSEPSPDASIFSFYMNVTIRV
jgi:hypothetical protein